MNAEQEPSVKTRFYASDAEDNHGAPWTPTDADSARGAAEEYAWDNGMEPDPTGEHGEDVVYVIEASEDEEIPEDWNVEQLGTPLTEHGSWRFRVVRVRSDGIDVEEL